MQPGQARRVATLHAQGSRQREKGMKTLKRCMLTLIALFVLCGAMTVRAETVLEVDEGSHVDPWVREFFGSNIMTDLRACLQEAKANATPENPYVIKVPAGTYDLYSKLHIGSNTTLDLTAGVTFVNRISNTMCGISSHATADYNGGGNVVIKGGVWNMNNIDNCAITASHLDGILIEGATFINSCNSHTMEFSACRNLTITGCTIADYTGDRKANTEAIQFDILEKSHLSKGEPYDDTPCSNITVTNCTFRNLQSGIGTHSCFRGIYFTNINFSNNTFENIQRHAIITMNYVGCTIANNTINGAGCGIFVQSVPRSGNNLYVPTVKAGRIVRNAATTITGNNITITKTAYKNVSVGIQIYGRKYRKKTKLVPKGNYRIEGVTISGNNITLLDSGYGIHCEGMDKSLIQANTVTVATTAKADRKGPGHAIELKNATRNKVLGNTLRKTSKNKKVRNAYGIFCGSWTKKNKIKGNKIKGFGHHKIKR